MWARRGGGAKREDRMGVGRVENAKIKEQEARSRNLDVVGMDGLTGMLVFHINDLLYV